MVFYDYEKCIALADIPNVTEVLSFVKRCYRKIFNGGLTRV